MIAEIALPLPFSMGYDYLVPEPQQALLSVGRLALVPFGPGFRLGVITKIKAESQVPNLKPLVEVLPEAPALHPTQLDFLTWIADYYLVSLGQVIEAALPGGVLPKIHPFVECQAEKTQHLDPKLREQLAQLHGQSLGPAQKERWKEYFKNGVLTWQASAKRVQPSRETWVLRCGQPEKPFRKGSVKEQLWNALEQSPQIPFAQLEALSDKAKTHLKEMEKAGLVKWEARALPEPKREIFSERFFPLNAEQEAAFDQISSALTQATFACFLLFGVTGSGKTEVYLQAVRQCLEAGKTALILLPEISLTPQAVARFQERFGERVAVLHSGLNDTERAQEWFKIKEKRCDLVIGARSALFAPLENIGLIVVDEEHDSSYKQQETPFYQARDLAVVWGQRQGAVVILGSATPSIESFHNARAGKYQLLVLSERATKAPLPEIEVLSLKQEARQQGVFYLSKQLYQELAENYRAGKQAILFLNRRGYAAFLSCKACGDAVLCDHCSLAMTWHKTKRQLLCHGCGHSRSWPSHCPSCGQEELQTEGIGTQRVERDMTALFPKARFLRMDRDTNQRKGELESNITKIHQGEVDFVIGTQLISKGHDFRGVGIVAILLADMSLNIPDFRSSERSFQLFSQVMGRAGRGEGEKGKAILQAYNPNHNAVHSAKEHDYVGFFERELEHRQILGLPPFQRQILIRFSDPKPEKAQSAAMTLAQKIKEMQLSQPIRLLGPIESGVFKLQNRYYWELRIQGEKLGEIKSKLRWLWFGERLQLGCRVSVDVDP